jgi:hypothetical protein
MGIRIFSFALNDDADAAFQWDLTFPGFRFQALPKDALNLVSMIIPVIAMGTFVHLIRIRFQGVNEPLGF